MINKWTAGKSTIKWAHDKVTCSNPKCPGDKTCGVFPSRQDHINHAEAAYALYAKADGTEFQDFVIDVIMAAEARGFMLKDVAGYAAADEGPETATARIARWVGAATDVAIVGGGDQDGELAAAYRQAAKDEVSGKEGELEVDDNAVVSFGDDDGAYVQAWLWVGDIEAKIYTCQECGKVEIDPKDKADWGGDGYELCPACCAKAEVRADAAAIWAAAQAVK